MKIIPISLHHVSLLFLFFLKVSAQPSSNDQSQQPQLNNLTPSMAIIIVILIAALFLMGFFSIYIRHCADSPSGGSIRALGLRSSLRRSRRPPRGLDPLVLQSFPTLQYSLVKAHKVGKGALECAVCLSEFDDSETLRLIPLCDHVFHPDCIDEWLSTHTTCPVCRADLVPKPDQSLHEVPDAAQNDVVVVEAEPEPRQQPQPEEESDVACLNQRNRTRGSRSGRARWFPRSHSTGHSLVQPGEDTERFTLRLPVEVRNQIMNRKFQRATSLIVLPTEGSSRRRYRISGDGSSRGGRYSSRRLDRGIKSDRWVFTMAPPFLVRASSIVRSPKVGGSAGEGTSGQTVGPAAADVARLPV